ncbi:MAG: peptidoglycan editing factor PgeF [Pseudomonadota bacterium]|nr:peptidoglycan editing factor PgeF [Pseudomonadota bacterium]
MLILRADNLALPGLAHGFFGRTGGVSTGLFASLNCGPGSGDDRAAVILNRRRVAEALAPDSGSDVRLINVHQIHSAKAVTVRAPWELGQGPEADAMASATPGIALGILTADCAPVLLADPEAGVIGAAHAGWKGALGGVLEAVIAGMEKLGAKPARTKAAIGPAISQANYEVGRDLRARFGDEDGRFFTAAGKDHFRFDLPAFAAHRLRQAGLASVAELGLCTYPPANRFFSYRRTTHRGETDYGRQLSAIALSPQG